MSSPISYSSLFIALLLLLLIVRYLSKRKKRVPVILENHPYECGPRCLQMIMQYYGQKVSFERLAILTNMDTEGCTMRDLTRACEQLSIRTLAVKIPYQIADQEQVDLRRVPLPCIVFWDHCYFVIVEKVSATQASIVHPAKGRLVFSKERFCESWIMDQSEDGVFLGPAILLERIS